MKCTIWAVMTIIWSAALLGQQQGDNWIMNNNILIKFSDGLFIVDTIATWSPYEKISYSVYSDSASNLIIYTDGMNYFNQNGELLVFDSLPSIHSSPLNFQRITFIEKGLNEILDFLWDRYYVQTQEIADEFDK